MSITIRETRNGLSIRTTGADAQRVLRAVTASLVPESAAVASKPVPNRSKPDVGATGAAQSLSVRVALRPKSGQTGDGHGS